MTDTALRASFPEEDRSGAMLAHLSGYAGYLFPCGGMIVPVAIAFTAKSPAVTAVACQALVLNLLGFVSVALGVYFSPMVLAIREPILQTLVMGAAGLCAIFVFALVMLCPLIGALRAWGGRFFRYPLVGIEMPR